jgi:hypothetical protein
MDPEWTGALANLLREEYFCLEALQLLYEEEEETLGSGSKNLSTHHARKKRRIFEAIAAFEVEIGGFRKRWIASGEPRGLYAATIAHYAGRNRALLSRLCRIGERLAVLSPGSRQPSPLTRTSCGATRIPGISIRV